MRPSAVAPASVREDGKRSDSADTHGEARRRGYRSILVREFAKGVLQLRGFPPNAINVYLVEEVVVDAATRHAGGAFCASSRAGPSRPTS